LLNRAGHRRVRRWSTRCTVILRSLDLNVWFVRAFIVVLDVLPT
jgi:hypothetical protein